MENCRGGNGLKRAINNRPYNTTLNKMNKNGFETGGNGFSPFIRRGVHILFVNFVLRVLKK